MTKRMNLVTLGALVAAYALGPMATQILTPAVPFVHRDFAMSMAAAQTLISLAFATIAMMTLVYGPLSDRFGRRPVILGGTALFCVGSVIAGLAPSPELLVIGRMLQAAGSAAGLVLTRTIVHDVYGRDRSGQVLAYLTVVMIFVPMLSPLAGGILLDHAGWRWIFGLCAGIGLGALAVLAAYLPETNAARRADLGLRDTFAAFASLARDLRYLGPALFFSLVMATFFATQAALPYLIVEVHGGTATEYGVWFAVACAFYVAGNYASGRWGHRVPRAKLIVACGAGCLATSVAGLATASILEWDTAVGFIPTLALCFFGAVAIAPAQAEAVSAQPGHSGAASGLMSGMQMAIGAAVVQLVGLSHDGTPFPMFAALVACSTLALVAFAAAGARGPRSPGIAAAAAR
jgi:DHA1 family bicyclomycin/chloramphenicol resistance-like MFS transporter